MFFARGRRAWPGAGVWHRRKSIIASWMKTAQKKRSRRGAQRQQSARRRGGKHLRKRYQRMLRLFNEHLCACRAFAVWTSVAS